jgi:glycine/D-amino acid oxidase-like deaminating enzyme
VQALFPLAKTDDLLAGFYVEDDGRVNPVDATMALAKGARMQGAVIREGVSALGVTSEAGRVTGVNTSAGHVACERVINCCGMWARQFGELSGVNIPLQAAEHYYLLTDSMPEVCGKRVDMGSVWKRVDMGNVWKRVERVGVGSVGSVWSVWMRIRPSALRYSPKNICRRVLLHPPPFLLSSSPSSPLLSSLQVDPSWPVLEDPSSHAYIRPEGGGLMVGLFEPDAAAWNVGKIPADSSYTVIPPDWDRMAPFLDKAMNRVPATLQVGMKDFFCGPESFTPDLQVCSVPSPQQVVVETV